MRSPEDLRRAASLLVGAELLFKLNGKKLPKLPFTQFQLMLVALEWASGQESKMFTELIAGIEETCYQNGIGIAEDGKPYPLTPTVVQ